MCIQNENTGKRYRQSARLRILVGVLIGAASAVAQLPTATVLGVVKDSSGAVVPGASLAIRNVETGQSRTATTGEGGAYRFAALPVGNYEIRVEHPGFQTVVRSGLVLTVSQEAVVNFALEVGGIEQTVAITAEAPLVNTTSGSLGGLVDERRVAELPLNGRNYIQLTLLQPGVMEHRTKSPGNETVGTWFSSNGAPVRSNSYLLDGAMIQGYGGTNTASMSGSTLGIEGIREYRVITNSSSAEYGMTMGSQMVIVSKGGSNTFHGSLLEYLRNDNLDARNFFDRKTALTPGRLPEFKRNNFGGSFGGPIRKDQLFFFGVYEGLRERLGVTTLSNVIPPSAKVEGGLVPQIAAVTRPLLALFPDPNLLPGNQFTFPFSQPTREDYGQMRGGSHGFDKRFDVRAVHDFGRGTDRAPQLPAVPNQPVESGAVRHLGREPRVLAGAIEYFPILLQPHQNGDRFSLGNHWPPILVCPRPGTGGDQHRRRNHPGGDGKRAQRQGAEYLYLER
ncbi:MAG: hypothetical protein A3J28_01850 [Acidobacteria bacterium RIFCSPLOWO2_12_FULL_60_22]|nr:MAG: hypothetical protein A3J28_01850 [Acidobacteria bacterium RIFCSPLOWO2_12_FULL_60_22]